MDITLSDLLPNANTGLSKIGFFFGAGTSFAAGYPLTSQLTIDVLKKLTPTEKELIERILKAEGIILNISKGEPDIELLSDKLNQAKASGGYAGIDLLMDSIRKQIVDVISEVNPNLEWHISFLKGLKKHMQHRNESVWIFTTNYDLLFELAASIVKIPIFNGFEGIAQRYFDIERIELTYGKIKSNRIFEQFNEPHIKLIKLHGSTSWFKEGDNIIESFNTAKTDDRCMILPKRTKVIETLESPYDKLFRYASSVIGKQCKFIVSCGYSYRDEHINDILFNSKLRENSIRVFALSKDETPEILKLKDHTSFHYMVNNKLHHNGKDIDGIFDLWDFKKFAELFN
jgi:SIR2-like domain